MKISSNKSLVFILCVSLTLDWNVVFAEKKDSEKGKKFRFDFSKLSPRCLALGATVGVVGIPATLWATGFGAGGIAAGSIASKLMSLSAVFYGGGVPAGGVVAGLQSAGAAGVYYLTTGAASALAAMGCELMEVDDEDADDEETKEENRHWEEENRHRQEEENRHWQEEENRHWQEEEKRHRQEEENRHRQEEENRRWQEESFQKPAPDYEANKAEKEAANPQESKPYDKISLVEQFLVVFYFFVTLMVASQESASYGKIIIIFSAIILLGLIFKLLREFLLHFLIAFCFFVICKGLQSLRQCIPQQG